MISTNMIISAQNLIKTKKHSIISISNSKTNKSKKIGKCVSK